MKLKLGLFSVLFVVACTTINQTIDDKKEKENAREKLTEVVGNSPACLNYFWKNRGKAYRSYMNGMALMYAKQVCGQGSDFIKSNKITSTYTLYSGTKKHQDALAYYGISGSELNTYTFLIGLGMRESNGRYCKGRDKSRDFKKGESAEAGIYQMAYVARVFNKELEPLYKKFKNGEFSCELDTFKSPEVTNRCDSYDAKTYGTGEGRNWQELMKRCPAASVAWAAILVRSQYRHFGPIIRKEVEYRNACRDMLKEVEKIAKPNCKYL